VILSKRLKVAVRRKWAQKKAPLPNTEEGLNLKDKRD
jgi:hypothetical protein